MCGIVSLVYGRDIPDMGRKAESLLKNSECAGNGSVGAAFIGMDGSLALLKGSGGTERLCRDRLMCSQAGQRFIGHCSPAAPCPTSEVNCQPYRAECRTELAGAISGTISNEKSLRTWLLQRDHIVVSSSEGELFIHLVEDHYATSAMHSSADLARMRQAYAHSGQRECMPDAVLRMIDSIRKADAIIEGSYAAVLADPWLPGFFAVRSGGELSAARDVDERGVFTIVASRGALTLTETAQPIPLADGDGIWCTEKSFVSFSLRGIQAFPKLTPASVLRN